MRKMHGAPRNGDDNCNRCVERLPTCGVGVGILKNVLVDENG